MLLQLLLVSKNNTCYLGISPAFQQACTISDQQAIKNTYPVVMGLVCAASHSGHNIESQRLALGASESLDQDLQGGLSNAYIQIFLLWDMGGCDTRVTTAVRRRSLRP